MRLAAWLALDRALAILVATTRALIPRDPWLRMPEGRWQRLSEVPLRRVMTRGLWVVGICALGGTHGLFYTDEVRLLLRWWRASSWWCNGT